MEDLYARIRDKVIEPLTVRRTRSDLKEPLKMPSVAFLETETKKCDFSFPSFSITYVIENGSTSSCCAGASNL